jgi:hypothetical protein
MATTNPTPKDSANSSINTLQDVWNQVVSTIEDALDKQSPSLIDALPATGKSRGLVEAINRTGEQVVIFTQRGRKEQYDQYEKWCRDFGLTCKTLPAVDELCPTFGENHGETQQPIHALRNAGASPSHIHDRLDLPCQESGPCPYEKAIDFDPDNYDVLVGHPKHAYVEEYVENRVPVFDEFPGDAYITDIENTADVVSTFLRDRGLPFDDYADLLRNRDKEYLRRIALDQLTQVSLIDEQSLFRKNIEKRHKLAGLCVLTLLKGEDLGNGWESAILGGNRVGVFNRNEGTVHILNPPDLPEHVLGLDGTPTKPMWDLALGFYDRNRRLDHQQVLDETERQQYVTAIQNLRIIPTTTNVRPYSGGTTKSDRDAALLNEVERQHTGTKGLISSRRGLDDLKEQVGELDGLETAYFGNLIGSNELNDVDVGVIFGSPHYGNDVIKKWTALAGVAGKSNGKSGLDKSYGEFGDKILQHMREHRVLQALFRFARQGDGATVYVDTVALPDWIPVVSNPEETTIDTWSSAEQDIIGSLKQLEEARTKKIADEADRHPRTVRAVLGDLPTDLISERRAEDGRGGAKVWIDSGIDSRNPYGQVNLSAPRSPTRFSEQSHCRGSKGIVPKKSSRQLRVQRERKQQAEFQRRRGRQIQQMQMERLYGSG